MKIAILVSEFPPMGFGGTEVATYNVAEHLAKRGHEVHVITFGNEGLPKERIEDGLYVHRAGFFGKPFLGYASYFISAFRIIRRLNPDLVHAQNISWALHALLIKKMLKKPYVVWGRGADIYLPPRFYRPFYRPTMMNADAVIAQTSDMKGRMQRFCNRDVYVIPNGIDLSRFNDLSREESRSRLQIGEDEKVVLFVGMLRPLKGVKYLIQAMRAVSQKVSEARLIVVGDVEEHGEEKRNLEKLARGLNLGDLVTFVGKVPNQEVTQYMAAGDVFVLPSLLEGFPMVIVEAMASGLPIVATNIGGLPEIVRNGENGFLVEPKNPAELASKILLLLQNDELWKRISRNNKGKAKAYSWDAVTDKLEMVYREHFMSYLDNHR